MYSFEGNYRTKPSQSLGGASKKEQKSALLQRTQEERQRREAHRKQVNSAMKIQSFYRACKEREKLRAVARSEYDAVCQVVQSGQATLENKLVELLRPLLFCFRLTEDAARLTWLCQQLIRDQSVIGKLVVRHSTGLLQVKHLLALCCSYLRHVCCSGQPLAIPMRMLEVYTSVQAYKQGCGEEGASRVLHHVLGYLIQNGYYECMQVLVQEKIPSSIEFTVAAPTPLAASILDLIRKPLDAVAANPNNLDFRDASFHSLCRAFLSVPFTEQISQWLLPALAHSTTFPFLALLKALLPSNTQLYMSHDQDMETDSPIPVMDWTLRVEPSPWLLYAVLTLSNKHLERLSSADLHCYVMVLYKLVPQLQSPRQCLFDEDSDDEDEEYEMDASSIGCFQSLSELRQYCVGLLNQPAHVRGLISTSSRNPDPATLTAICTVCHTLIAHNKLLIHNTRLLYSLAFNPVFLKNLWYACASVSTETVTGSHMTLLQMISRGMLMPAEDMRRIVPLLSVFCSLFSHLLLSLHDTEFYGDDLPDTEVQSSSSMPFPVSALVPMSQALRDCCLGLIELSHPESRPAIKEDYKKAFQSVGAVQNVMTEDELHDQLETLAYLFKVMQKVVKQLYARDIRRQFTAQEDHWLSRQISVHAERHSQIFKSGAAFVKRPFGALSALKSNRSDKQACCILTAVDEDGPLLSTTDVRQLTVLTEMPFVVPFTERIKIFQRLVNQDKVEHQGEMRHLVGGPLINIMVRRNYLYEDAFEKLSVENEPNLKLKMQVQLVNFAGLDEAGIDGGGIFREFMSELIKTAFDPNRGFIRATQDKLLYPNAQAQLIVENFTQHYYFLGRILGKAIYENMLVEIPFASFFLLKILSRTRAGDLDIHHLQSMDPEMYKNLLSLKNFEGDVCELGLDFTVVNNDLGEAQVEELKPGGRDLLVDNHNRIEYIYLMANYRLNRQIRQHVNAFRQGLADVINLEWLRMFDYRELQTLISGAEEAIDLEDLKQHTNYSGGYSDDHAVIQAFWSAVAKFSATQKRQLLKFVTSCSRPPLLGFKELHPAFCIHYAGNEGERLPTASTCMNLLKLPEFQDEETLRTKLLYAIESSSGFELS